MKKGLAIAAGVLSLCALCADDDSDWAADISGNASIDFQTEYAYRGRQNGKMAIVPELWIGYNATDEFQIYAGLDGVFNMKKKFGDKYDLNGVRIPDNLRSDWRYFNRISPYVGVEYKFNDMFALDAGYQHSFYTKKFNKEYRNGHKLLFGNEPKRDTNEIYVGALMDYAINDSIKLDPSLYVTYGFENKEINVEGRVSCDFDLSDKVAPGVGIDVGAKLGFDHAKKFWKTKIRRYERVADFLDFGKKSYWYYGANADLVYSFNEKIRARAGVEYVGNSAKKKSWVNLFGNAHKNMVWFNAGLDCAF
jgi:long-subunit fatty acid transport protein